MKYYRKECLQAMSVSSIIILKIDTATTKIDSIAFTAPICFIDLDNLVSLKKRDFWLKITV